MPYKTRERRLQYCRDYAKKNRAKMTSYSREWRRSHRETERARLAKWRKDNPDKHYKINREGGWKYRGIRFTLEQYDTLFRAQNGVCAVCKKPSSKRLVVDHNHESGLVRGLLCNFCNRFVVLVAEKFPYLYQQAKLYLENYGTKASDTTSESRAVGLPCFQ